ncbi:MAG: RHS repeat-associated core domain-containing protein, partial [Verrucomicrobiae bacterium]|nr:RHS repeat-associated core domain-containing protein [Verrucomicrobiae bacterium]
VWGARPGHRDELILRDRDTDGNGTLDERLYCLMDYYNPTAVLNSAGEVRERYAWSAFGLRRIMEADWTARSFSAYAFDFGFHGQFLDGETGYYDYGLRYYSGSIGRWIEKDPIKEKGGVNLYCYGINNAINRNDAFGLIPYSDCAIHILVDHHGGAIRGFSEWRKYGGTTSTPHGEIRPHYAAMIAFGCYACEHSENIEPACPTGSPSGFDTVGVINALIGAEFGVPPAWNGGFNPNKDPGNYNIQIQEVGFIRLVSENWKRGLDKAQEFSDSCSADEWCCCNKITVNLVFGTEIYVDRGVARYPAANSQYFSAWEDIRSKGLIKYLPFGFYTKSDYPNLDVSGEVGDEVWKAPRGKISATFSVTKRL